MMRKKSLSKAKLKALFNSEDEWMDGFHQDNLGLPWKEGGATLNGPILVVNQIAMFGKIHALKNCTLNITISSFDMSGSSSSSEKD